jgi:RecA-family ATPase
LSAFRFGQYLKGVKASDGEQAESDLREIEFKKNQYGPLGESIVLRYQRGLFLPEAGVSGLDKAARVVKAEDVFIALLHRFSSQKRHVSDKPTAPNYGPSVFAKEDEAKKYGLKKVDLEQSMRALFRADRSPSRNTAGHRGLIAIWCERSLKENSALKYGSRNASVTVFTLPSIQVD